MNNSFSSPSRLRQSLLEEDSLREPALRPAPGVEEADQLEHVARRDSQAHLRFCQLLILEKAVAKNELVKRARLNVRKVKELCKRGRVAFSPSEEELTDCDALLVLRGACSQFLRITRVRRLKQEDITFRENYEIRRVCQNGFIIRLSPEQKFVVGANCADSKTIVLLLSRPALQPFLPQLESIIREHANLLQKSENIAGKWSPLAVWLLAKCCQEENLPEQQQVYNQGEEPKFGYLVTQGNVVVTKGKDDQGHNKYRSSHVNYRENVPPGRMFGLDTRAEAGVELRASSAVVEEECKLLRFERTVLIRLLKAKKAIEKRRREYELMVLFDQQQQQKAAPLSRAAPMTADFEGVNSSGRIHTRGRSTAEPFQSEGREADVKFKIYYCDSKALWCDSTRQRQTSKPRKAKLDIGKLADEFKKADVAKRCLAAKQMLELQKRRASSVFKRRHSLQPREKQTLPEADLAKALEQLRSPLLFNFEKNRSRQLRQRGSVRTR